MYINKVLILLLFKQRCKSEVLTVHLSARSTNSSFECQTNALTPGAVEIWCHGFGVFPTYKMRKGKRCSHSIALSGLALGSNGPEILVSYQETFLERRRAGPGKRSRTRHQHVGKVSLAFCFVHWAGWELCLVFEACPIPPAPSRHPRLERGCREGTDVLWMLAWPLSHSAGGQSQGCKLRHCSLFPELVPNRMNKSFYPELQFSHLVAKYFDALRWKAIQALLYERTLLHPLSDYALQLLPKNVVMQAFFMVFFFFS